MESVSSMMIVIMKTSYLQGSMKIYMKNRN